MAAKYPQWIQPLPMPPLTRDGKIRVGYVSKLLRAPTPNKWALGWMKYANKQKFEIYCYHLGQKTDYFTELFRDNSNVFHHIPTDIEGACQQIIADRLHVVFFTDIGLTPKITRMAGLRLAPVQCTGWGHTVTSGLPTIDYYLSSELMDSENGDSHYSEQLIRLPNIGLCYAKPIIPKPEKNRPDFRLPDDAVVYLSNQSLFKYLPQYDYVFAAIASQVPQAKIVFISHPSTQVTDKFGQRLQRAFASVGLNSEDYCVIVPRQDRNGYCDIIRVADIFLDTFSWSGGNTTLDAIALHARCAIACNLPVVTCPGEFMGGRQSYAMLKMLGVTETIAKDLDEYIEIAVRLGKEREWRSSIVEKISQRHSYLYDDKTCVAALEDFYQSVVRGGGQCPPYSYV